jgi:hypothetical protein
MIKPCIVSNVVISRSAFYSGIVKGRMDIRVIATSLAFELGKNDKSSQHEPGSGGLEHTNISDSVRSR